MQSAIVETGSGAVVTSATVGQPPLSDSGWKRLSGILEGIVFYGILAFGLSAPLAGALYAKLFL